MRGSESQNAFLCKRERSTISARCGVQCKKTKLRHHLQKTAKMIIKSNGARAREQWHPLQFTMKKQSLTQHYSRPRPMECSNGKDQVRLFFPAPPPPLNSPASHSSRSAWIKISSHHNHPAYPSTTTLSVEPVSETTSQVPRSLHSVSSPPSMETSVESSTFVEHLLEVLRQRARIIFHSHCVPYYKQLSKLHQSVPYPHQS